MRSVVIVGAGLAGARCAETLRAEGYDGELVLVGDEPVPPYERPALSKEFLAGEREAASLALRPPSFWEARRIRLELGQRVVALDGRRRTVRTEAGRSFACDRIVLATGARPRRLPFAAPGGVHVLRSLTEATALRRALVPEARLVIVGGGFVGAEVASTAAALGVQVTMLDAGEAPFARMLGPELGRLLAARYRAHGVDVRARTTAVGFASAHGRVRSVALSDGSGIRCDAVLVAIGADPARELAYPGIDVCGDAAGSGHWTAAAHSGANAARRLLELEPLPAPPPFFWSDQFGLRMQLVGEPSGAASVTLEGGEPAFVARFHAPSGRLVAALAANRADAVGDLRRELALAA